MLLKKFAKRYRKSFNSSFFFNKYFEKIPILGNYKAVYLLGTLIKLLLI